MMRMKRNSKLEAALKSHSTKRTRPYVPRRNALEGLMMTRARVCDDNVDENPEGTQCHPEGAGNGEEVPHFEDANC